MKGQKPPTRPEGWLPPDGPEAAKLYSEGRYSLKPPSVRSNGWTSRDWRCYISNGGGRWLPAEPSATT